MLEYDDLVKELGEQVLKDSEMLVTYMDHTFVARFPFHYAGTNFWIHITIDPSSKQRTN